MPAKLLLYWDGVSWGSCSMSREGPGHCCSPFLEGSSIRPTKPTSCCRLKGIEHVSGGGTFWVSNRDGCVGLSVL